MATRISKNDIPPFVCTLYPDTAASLHHILMAQQVHAQNVADESGLTALLEASKKIQPFCDAIAVYLTTNYK